MKGRVLLVVGEAKHSGEDAELLFAALEDDLPGCGIDDVEVVGGLVETEVFLREEGVEGERTGHGRCLRVCGGRNRLAQNGAE